MKDGEYLECLGCTNSASNVINHNQSKLIDDTSKQFQKMYFKHDGNVNIIKQTSNKKDNKVACKQSKERLYQVEVPDCVIIDLETTGLNEIDDEIIEIGALKINGGKVVDTFQRIIAIENRLPEFIIKLTGITDKDISERGIDLNDALIALSGFIENYPLVAHNISFDIAFLNQAYTLCNIPVLKNKTICTLELSRSLLPQLKSHKLNFLIEHFGITSEGAHRSIRDCENVFYLYQKLLSIKRR